jgi:riboflavin synthase
LIPLTFQDTIIGQKNVGDIVNIENDMIGKYIVQHLQTNKPKQTLTQSFLAENGFY